MKYYSKYTAAVCLSLGIGFSSQALQAESVVEKEKPVVKKAAEMSALNVGDAMPDGVFDGVTWVQGAELKSLNEPGKVYIFENWATWCGPCIAVIPHVNDLHKKYADKGLVIIGMNVWEDGLDKVEAFVKKQGEGMSYRIAYSGGRGSGFENKVLKPAKVKGIPRALVVKDGKLIASLHPSQITDAMVGQFMDGSFDAVAFDNDQKAKAKAQEEARAKLNTIIKEKDWDGLKEYAEAMDAKDRRKPMFLATAVVNKGEWDELIALRNDFKNELFGDKIGASYLDSQVVRSAEISEGAKSYADLFLADFKMPEADAKPVSFCHNHFMKARFEFMAGNKEVAAAELVKAKGYLDKIESERSKTYFTRSIDAAIKKVDGGSFPNSKGLMK